MSYDDARREVERTTVFDVRGGRVWLREVRWLQAVDDLRGGDAVVAAPTWGARGLALAGRAA